MGIALLILLTSAIGGWLLRDGLRSHQAGANAAMQRALDGTPSNSTTQLEDGTSIKLTSTFASIQKRWCREYIMLFQTAHRPPG